MYVVIDVNVILSSLLTRGDSFNVFAINNILNKHEFVAPEFLLEELEKNKQEIKKRTKLSDEKFEKVFSFLLNQIIIIPKSEFESLIEKSEKILKGHEKDAHYLALALKLNCLIFSGDKVFKKFCSDRVLSPREMLDRF